MFRAPGIERGPVRVVRFLGISSLGVVGKASSSIHQVLEVSGASGVGGSCESGYVAIGTTYHVQES